MLEGEGVRECSKNDVTELERGGCIEGCIEVM